MSKILPSVLGWALVSAIAATCFCTPALAHARLRSSVPANNAQLTAAPTVITLVFNEAAQLAMLKLVTASKEISVSIDPNAKAASNITVPLPPLTPGQYAVTWSALSPNDGHLMKGSFSFAIRVPK